MGEGSDRNNEIKAFNDIQEGGLRNLQQWHQR